MTKPDPTAGISLSDGRVAFIKTAEAAWRRWGKFALDPDHMPSELIVELTNCADFYAGWCTGETLRALGYDSDWPSPESFIEDRTGTTMEGKS